VFAKLEAIDFLIHAQPRAATEGRPYSTFDHDQIIVSMVIEVLSSGPAEVLAPLALVI